MISTFILSPERKKAVRQKKTKLIKTKSECNSSRIPQKKLTCGTPHCYRGCKTGNWRRSPASPGPSSAAASRPTSASPSPPTRCQHQHSGNWSPEALWIAKKSASRTKNNTQQRVATKWEVSESNAAAKRHQWSSIQGLAESAIIYGFRRKRPPALQLRLGLVSGSVPARQVILCFGITAEPSPSLHDTRDRFGSWFGW